MQYLCDMIVLVIFASFNLFFIRLDLAFICFTLMTVILICVEYYFMNNYILYIMLVCYGIGTFGNLSAVCFFPVIFYLLCKRKKYILAVIQSLILLFISWRGAMEQPMFWVSFFGMSFALYLYHKSVKMDALRNVYRKSRDDSCERTLLLKEKNKTLIENQNYQIYTATLKERNRIARDIHDNVGHMLSRSILMTGALKTVNKQENLTGVLEDLSTTLNSAMDNIRASVHDLRDESVNLKEVVNDLVDGFSFCPVTLHYDMGVGVPSTIKYSFISIIKEALSNVARHSDATKVDITIREHPYLYQLVIIDNGTKVNTKDHGMGLENMKERVNVLKGTVNFVVDSGFKIFITVPKTQVREKDEYTCSR